MSRCAWLVHCLGDEVSRGLGSRLPVPSRSVGGPRSCHRRRTWRPRGRPRRKAALTSRDGRVDLALPSLVHNRPRRACARARRPAAIINHHGPRRGRSGLRTRREHPMVCCVPPYASLLRDVRRATAADSHECTHGHSSYAAQICQEARWGEVDGRLITVLSVEALDKVVEPAPARCVQCRPVLARCNGGDNRVETDCAEFGIGRVKVLGRVEVDAKKRDVSIGHLDHQVEHLRRAGTAVLMHVTPPQREQRRQFAQ
mmetsp:Transcript_4602/g.7628  ORF Transcript_4602/g.7628 Transcript_4602/m.7628 type:complete len:257 (-) Transcript_4602:640-1410(-)